MAWQTGNTALCLLFQTPLHYSVEVGVIFPARSHVELVKKQKLLTTNYAKRLGLILVETVFAIKRTILDSLPK